LQACQHDVIFLPFHRHSHQSINSGRWWKYPKDIEKYCRGSIASTVAGFLGSSYSVWPNKIIRPMRHWDLTDRSLVWRRRQSAWSKMCRRYCVRSVRLEQRFWSKGFVFHPFSKIAISMLSRDAFAVASAGVNNIPIRHGGSQNLVSKHLAARQNW
jgi:hypothetical protein